MKHTKKIITLGIVVTIVPFLGFPSSWKTIIFAALGLAIAGFGYRILMEIRHLATDEENDVYTQSAIHGAEPMIAHE